jgi:membrane protein
MAWHWKQGRPRLLTMIGLGVLGYKVLQRGRAEERPGQRSVSVVEATQPRRTHVTSTPAERQTKTPFLGGLRVTELAKRVVREVQQDNCLGQAAQLAYYFIFAVFPFLLFLATLLGYLPIPNLLDRIMASLAALLPGEAVTLLQDNVRHLVTDQKGGLLSFGILTALWASSSAVVAIMDALNRAYDVEEGRPFWKVRGSAILLTVGLSLFIMLSMVLLIFGPQLGRWIAALVGLGNAFAVAWNILRWPVIVGLLVVAMAIIYYVAPDVEQQWKWITPGAVFAVLVTIVVSVGFSLYVNSFGSYNKTYGSIGAVIVFLTWLYLTGFVILVGGEINAEIEHAAPEGKAPGAKTGA